MNNDEYDDEFLEILSDYENALSSGVEPYLDACDAVDIAQYYDSREQTDQARRVLKLGLRLHPGDPEVISFLVRITVVSDKNIQLAHWYADQMISSEPSVDTILAHTDILIAEGKLAEADQMALDALSSFDEEEQNDLCVEMSQMYCFADQYEHSLSWLRRCKTKDTQDYLELLSETTTALGMYDESAKAYSQLLDIDAFSLLNWNNLASVQLLNNKIDDAIESTDYALAIDNNDVFARYYKACALSNKGCLNEAEELFGQLWKEIASNERLRNNDEFKATLAVTYSKCLYDENKIDESLEMLSLAEKFTASNDEQKFEIMKQRILILTMMNRTDEALVTVNEMFHLFDNDDYPELYIMKGVILKQKSENHDADRLFDLAEEKSRYNLHKRFLVSACLHDFSEYKEAERFLEDLVKHNGGQEGLAYLASCYKHTGKGWLSYLTVLRKACEKTPDEVTLVFMQDMHHDMRPIEFFLQELKNIEKNM